jgi:hypothetical protein
MPSTSNACRRARSYRRPSSIEHNHVVNSGRTGLWVSGVDGGSIRDNIIIGWDRHPELPFFGINAQTQAQLQQDQTAIGRPQCPGRRDARQCHAAEYLYRIGRRFVIGATVREAPARRTKEGLPRRLELRNAVRIAQRRHLPQTSIDVGRVSVGKNSGLIGRHESDPPT